MKYVREHINEKFTDESDPIKDMGIGFKDSIDVNSIDLNYSKDIKTEFDKIIIRAKRKLKYNLDKKLVGKIISGEFYSYDTHSYRNKSFRIKKISIKFYSRNNIDRIYVYTSKGTKYMLVTHTDYKLTV